MAEEAKTPTKRGGARAGAGRKKLADARVRKTVFLHQSEWELLESKCQEGETVSHALCRILGQAVSQKQGNDKLEAFKRRHRRKAVAKVQSVQGEVTELDQRNMEFITDHLSRLFSDVRGIMRSYDPERGKMQIEALYKQALALEMVLDALDDRVFSNRLERLRTPKGIDTESIEQSLIGD